MEDNIDCSSSEQLQSTQSAIDLKNYSIEASTSKPSSVIYSTDDEGSDDLRK